MSASLHLNPWDFFELSSLRACFDLQMVLKEHTLLDLLRKSELAKLGSFVMLSCCNSMVAEFTVVCMVSCHLQSNFLPGLNQLFLFDDLTLLDAANAFLRVPRSQSCASFTFGTLQCVCLLAENKGLGRWLLHHSLDLDCAYHSFCHEAHSTWYFTPSRYIRFGLTDLLFSEICYCCRSFSSGSKSGFRHSIRSSAC